MKRTSPEGQAIGPSAPAASRPGGRPLVRLPLRVLKALLLLLLAIYFAFGLLVVGVRHALLPNIDAYRGGIEKLLAASLNLPVRIGGISADWRGLNPHLSLSSLALQDAQGRQALAFDRVEVDVAWTSLIHRELRLKRLEIAAPSLSIRRDSAGRIFVAGLALEDAGQADGFSSWLMKQRHIIVRDATITWQDELRGAPPLALRQVGFHLQNQGRRHRFGLTAAPPRQLAARLDVRGDFRGDGLNLAAAAQGAAYAELAYADLAAWRQWIDYPLELPRGAGAMRLWLNFGQGELTSLTGDINLQAVAMRLKPDLPMLELSSISGRLSGKRKGDGFEARARDLAWATAAGGLPAPADFMLQWRQASQTRPEEGRLTADRLDLAAVSELARHLPLPAEVRGRLAEATPRGKLSGLSWSWRGAADDPASYELRARFEGLGIEPAGMLPGFANLSGSVEASQQGGNVVLQARNAALILPRIFAEPRLELSSLDAKASWKSVEEGYELKLARVAFENRDAAGVASGSYRGKKGEAGSIDVQARLHRANAAAVWRYIPLVVDAEVRDWLRTSLLRGASDDVTLRLRGDLARFPYADGSGVFEVKGGFYGASLRYGDDWPQIDNIAGELHFSGRGMLIRAHRGNVHGVGLSDVRARIEDLGAAQALLSITGRAAGASADFLRFIADSPVAELIDHYTDDMSAAGGGQLGLRLALPLGNLADTRVDGVYQFFNNRLIAASDLPPLTELNGRLQFSGDSLRGERLTARLLDQPVSFDLRTTGDGALAISADGSFSVAALRRDFAHPLLDHLSGSASFRGTALVRNKNVELVLESRLAGISSSLPQPFNKSVAEVLPLRLERRLLPRPQAERGAAPVREQLDIAVAGEPVARLVRRQDGAGKKALERAALALGAPLVLPERGVTLAVRRPRLDVDAWRSIFAAGGAEAAPSLAAIDLQAGELLVLGRSFHDVSLKARARETGWHGSVRSREMSGEIEWKDQAAGEEAGRLFARLKKLVISDNMTAGARSDEALERLPGLDIQADEFLLRDKSLGRLTLNADNRRGVWEARVDIDNGESRLSGNGRWQPGTPQPDTELQFTLDVHSVERLLARLGYPEGVRRGQATLGGKVSWNGAPFAIDYPSLSGELEVQAARGQFNKLEPGAGRLLGILSLQSLPRRITLDFRDVFSEGFAFDAIAGKLHIRRGVMETDDLRIVGPGAKIMMTGSVSLPEETQDLHVRVQPSLGETLSVGAVFLANPAAGAIAYLAQKILRDPIDRMFSYEYAISGTWNDPKVEKLSMPRLGAEPGRRKEPAEDKR